MRTITEDLYAPAIKAHTASKRIETPEEWEEAQAFAEEMVKFWDEKNGTFPYNWERGYALHASQVDSTGEPYNFFVLDRAYTVQVAKDSEEFKDADGETRAEAMRKRLWPAQVIYNPEIVTAVATFLDKIPDRKGKKLRTVAAPNVLRLPEACMSYPRRKEKKVDRFYRMTVRYQYFDDKGTLQTNEEVIAGLKAHIFQHEWDHAQGWDIAYGKGDGTYPTIQDREVELGHTRAEIEKFTYEKISEVEANIQTQGWCLLEHAETGVLYRAPTTLSEMPEGFIEPDVIENYNEDGTIKAPNDTAPLYTEAPKDHEVHEDTAKS